MVEPSETLTQYLERFTEGVRGVLGNDLVAVYLHGSGALGGFRPEASDVDVMVFVARSLDLEAKSRVVRAIWGMPEGPGRGLECWIIATHTVQSDWREPQAEVFISTHHVEPITRDRPDLNGRFPMIEIDIMRDRGVTITGPPAGELIVPVPRPAMCRDMNWHLRFGLENTRESYGVLNASRSLAKLETGEHLSKIDGGEWALAKGIEPQSVIRHALDAQRGLVMDRPLTAAGRRFIENTMRIIEEAAQAAEADPGTSG